MYAYLGYIHYLWCFVPRWLLCKQRPSGGGRGGEREGRCSQQRFARSPDSVIFIKITFWTKFFKNLSAKKKLPAVYVLLKPYDMVKKKMVKSKHFVTLYYSILYVLYKPCHTVNSRHFCKRFIIRK